ncbi:TerD family protein, partial [Streptomyces sp. NRRL B-24572]|uniref:TerD family protein n=1 Tax=Streptomyces sp. NRRL B-24572 TaxID=1962156 RepID=UPI000A37896C
VADWLEIDTARVEPAVQRIVITASSEDGTFGEVPGLHIRTTSAATGEQLALYEVDDASTETAFLLGEFYRRDGAWKFRAVGQGYDSGLVGLATDFGIVGRDPEPVPEDESVHEDAPPGPEAIPEELLAKVREDEAAAVRTPAQVPVQRSPRLGPQSDVELFGEDFPEFFRSGKGKAVITVDVPIPAGYLVVDTTRRGDGYFSVRTLDEKGEGDVLLASTTLKDHEGRGLLRYDGKRPLRLRVSGYDEEWTVALRPVSTVETLDGTAEGRGGDVLLYGGPAALLTSRLHTRLGHAYFSVRGHEPDGRDHLLATAASRLPRDTRPLPEGPLLVQVRSAEGDWSLKVRPPKENRFWRRGTR